MYLLETLGALTIIKYLPPLGTEISNFRELSMEEGENRAIHHRGRRSIQSSRGLSIGTGN